MPTVFACGVAKASTTHLLLLVKSIQVERSRRKSNQHIENPLAFHKFYFALNGVLPDLTRHPHPHTRPNPNPITRLLRTAPPLHTSLLEGLSPTLLHSGYAQRHPSTPPCCRQPPANPTPPPAAPGNPRPTRRHHPPPRAPTRPQGPPPAAKGTHPPAPVARGSPTPPPMLEAAVSTLKPVSLKLVPTLGEAPP